MGLRSRVRLLAHGAPDQGATHTRFARPSGSSIRLDGPKGLSLKEESPA